MTPSQLRDLVRASNPVSQPDSLLSDEHDVLVLYAHALRRADHPHASNDLLEHSVERSTPMHTKDRETAMVSMPEETGPRRLPAILVGIAAVLIVVIGVWTTRSSDSDVAQRALTPLEVVDEFNQLTASGDWTALAGLFAADAQFEVRGEGDDVFVPLVALSEHTPQTPHDWDGDGAVNGIDGLIDDSARQHAAGTATFIECTETGPTTLSCEEVWEEFAFRRTEHIPTLWTVTIQDGAITELILQLVPRPRSPIDPSLLADYHAWVSENREQLIGDLFEDPQTMLITPESSATHRGLIAEWRASR